MLIRTIGLAIVALYSFPLYGDGGDAAKYENCEVLNVSADNVPTGASEKAAKIKSMQKERLEVLSEAVQFSIAQYREGKISFTTVAQIERDVFKATIDLHESPEERMAALRNLQAVVVHIYHIAETRYKTGNTTKIDVNQAKAVMLEVQIEVLREELKAKAQK